MANSDYKQSTSGGTAASFVSTPTEVYLSSEGDNRSAAETYLIIAIGITGTLANALVLYALLTTPKLLQKSHINVLFANQMATDLFVCCALTISFSLMLSTVPINYALCAFVCQGIAVWICVAASAVNQVAVAVDRYIMVVHPFWHKAHIRPRTIYAAVALIWLGSVATNGIGLLLVRYENGVCESSGHDPLSVKLSMAFGLCGFAVFCIYVTVFVFCYTRILLVIRRQRLAIAAHSHVDGEAAEASMPQAEINAVITSALLVISYIVGWTPNETYVFLSYVSPPDNVKHLITNVGYQASIILWYLNVCFNPFIYAWKYDPVRQRLGRMATSAGKTLRSIVPNN